MSDDLNGDLKDENIEITASALTHPDDDDMADDEVADEAASDPELDEFSGGEDDELETDKMDFEPEEKDLL
jgi:hypothetical protein